MMTYESKLSRHLTFGDALLKYDVCCEAGVTASLLPFDIASFSLCSLLATIDITTKTYMTKVAVLTIGI